MEEIYHEDTLMEIEISDELRQFLNFVDRDGYFLINYELKDMIFINKVKELKIKEKILIRNVEKINFN